MTVPDNAPNRINGYQVLEVLGRGGMGIVYRARQISIGRDIALKVLSPNLVQDQVFARRLLAEARSAGKLDHPNIVKAIDAGEADGFHYFAMEFVKGRNLGSIIAESGGLPVQEVLNIALQIARALRYAAERNMVHLDLKPANILLTEEGVPKLADFGLARHTHEQEGLSTDKTAMFGTPRYVSPEHLSMATDLDSRSDVYSLGVTLYEMIAGVPAFGAGSPSEVVGRVKSGECRPLSEQAPDAPADVCAVVSKMMAVRRQDRYQDVAALIADLEALQRGIEPAYALGVAPRPAAGEPEPVAAEPAGRLKLCIAAALTAWFLLVGFVVGPVLAGWVAERVKNAALPDEGDRPPARYSQEMGYRRGLFAARRLAGQKHYGRALELLAGLAQGGAASERLAGATSSVRRQAQADIESVAEKVLLAVDDTEWDRARELADSLCSYAIPEAEAEARRLKTLADRREAAHQRKVQAERAKRAFDELSRRIEELREKREFLKALEACDDFIARERYAELHLQAEALREPLALMGAVLRSALTGAERRKGQKVGPLEGAVVSSGSGKITVRRDGERHVLRVEDLAGPALVELAEAGGARADARFHAGLAMVLSAAERWEGAYRHATEALRQGGRLPNRSRLVVSDRAAECLHQLARKAASDEDWTLCLARLNELKKAYGHTGYFAKHAGGIAEAKQKASHQFHLSQGMVYVSGGAVRSPEGERRHVEAFYVDATEVSVKQYARFLRSVERATEGYDLAPRRGEPAEGNSSSASQMRHPDEPAGKDHTPLQWSEQLKHPEKPVVGVDWFDAYAYAYWCNRRLPTEEQWERAARGDALQQRYPWGSAWDAGRANSALSPELANGTSLMDVDSLPQGRSPAGCFHMSGNAREWTASRRKGSPSLYIIKGGSYLDLPAALSITDRTLAERLCRDGQTGFRCCVPAAEAKAP